MLCKKVLIVKEKTYSAVINVDNVSQTASKINSTDFMMIHSRNNYLEILYLLCRVL